MQLPIWNIWWPSRISDSMKANVFRKWLNYAEWCLPNPWTCWWRVNSMLTQMLLKNKYWVFLYDDWPFKHILLKCFTSVIHTVFHSVTLYTCFYTAGAVALDAADELFIVVICCHRCHTWTQYCYKHGFCTSLFGAVAIDVIREHSVHVSAQHMNYKLLTCFHKILTTIRE